MSEPQFVLFHGDAYRCERSLQEREAALCLADPSLERHVRFAEEVDVASLDIELQSVALFSLGRHFVIRHVDRIRAPKAWVSWIDKGLSPETFVSLVAADLKATSPVRKAAEKVGRVVALPAPQPRSAVQTVRSVASEFGLRLSPTAAEIVAQRTGGELFSVVREAEKLRSFAAADGIPDDAVAALTFSGIEPTVYPFYDRLGERNLAGALRALDELREDPGRLLGGAIRHLTRLAMLRLLIEKRVPQAKMASLTGLPDWLLRRLLGQARRFRLEEATAALDLGVHLDTQVKSGGIQAFDALLKLLLEVVLPEATPSAAAVHPERG